MGRKHSHRLTIRQLCTKQGEAIAKESMEFTSLIGDLYWSILVGSLSYDLLL